MSEGNSMSTTHVSDTSFEELHAFVSALTLALGRPLRLEEITPDEWRRELPAFIPVSIANILLAAWAGAIGQPALVTSTVAEITGMPPRTFREWATDNAAEFH